MLVCLTVLSVSRADAEAARGDASRGEEVEEAVRGLLEQRNALETLRRRLELQEREQEAVGTRLRSRGFELDAREEGFAGREVQNLARLRDLESQVEDLTMLLGARQAEQEGGGGGAAVVDVGTEAREEALAKREAVVRIQVRCKCTLATGAGGALEFPSRDAAHTFDGCA